MSKCVREGERKDENEGVRVGGRGAWKENRGKRKKRDKGRPVSKDLALPSE